MPFRGKAKQEEDEDVDDKQDTAKEIAEEEINLHAANKPDVRTATLPAKRPPITGYEPRDHRTPANPIAPGMAYLNMVRTMLGAGVLALPLAMSQAGIILGSIIAVLMTVLIVHGHMSLLWSLNEICRQLEIPHISYRYGFRMALLRGPPILRYLGAMGQKVIAIFMILAQLGICTVYVIFTSDSLRDLCDFKSNFVPTVILFFPYMILEYFMRTIKVVSYISLAGSVMTVTALALVSYELYKYQKNAPIIYIAKKPLPVMFAIGSYLFNMSAIVVVLTIDRGLVQPKVLVKRFGILQLGMGLPCILCSMFGAYGYYTMGNMDENILRSLPLDQTLTYVVLALYLVAIALAFPLQYYPITAITTDLLSHSDYNPSEKTLLYIQSILRPLFVFSVFLLCNIVPFQGAFVAFVGNLITSLLTLVFPSLMELSLRYPDHYGWYKIHLVKSVLIILFGLSSTIFGAILCFSLLYIRYLHLSNIDYENYL